MKIHGLGKLFMKIHGQLLFFIIILVFMFLTGCAKWNAGVAAGSQAAREAADKAYYGARWYVCKGASVGAVNRAHGGNPDPYKNYCRNQNKGVVGK